MDNSNTYTIGAPLNFDTKLKTALWYRLRGREYVKYQRCDKLFRTITEGGLKQTIDIFPFIHLFYSFIFYKNTNSAFSLHIGS